MVSPDQVKSMIQAGIPEAEVQVQDLTGGGDHYQVIVISPAFEGKRPVQRHQLVYRSVQQAMSTEAIHALSIKTYTPETWATTSQSA
ncbi:MAG: BolA/IbaG family iron-sulfur metabolism protein [Elainellaceae cyanobacterium]